MILMRLIQAREFPNASYDSMGQLRVGAAVSTRYGRRGERDTV